jgi:TRAP-type C4-dicarboxylate transport system permease large subunit
MVLVIVSGAIMFGHFLAITRLPYGAANWIGSLPLPNYAIMAVIVLLYLLGGCFMDSLAMILLTIPILFPMVTAMGYDPIWFGVVIVLVAEMGAITPPVGINVYVLSGIARDIPLETIFKGSLPFVLCLLALTALLIAFPQIALFLPDLMK